jgi:hypothetical protein
MIIYFKELAKDLLEVCRMLDDKPEAKTKLSEIAFDVSLLPDLGYGFENEIELPAERLEILNYD